VVDAAVRLDRARTQGPRVRARLGRTRAPSAGRGGTGGDSVGETAGGHTRADIHASPSRPCSGTFPRARKTKHPAAEPGQGGIALAACRRTPDPRRSPGARLEQDLADASKRLQAAEKARDAAIATLEQAATRGTTPRGKR